VNSVSDIDDEVFEDINYEFVNINHIATYVCGDLNDDDDDEVDEDEVEVKLRECVTGSYTDTSTFMTVHVDSQCNKGVTSDINLFNNGDLFNDTNFQVYDWHKNLVVIDKHGPSVFGDIMYSELTGGTILSMDEMYKSWRFDWNPEVFEVIMTHKSIPDLVLVGKSNNGVLDVSMTKEEYEFIIKQDVSQIPQSHDTDGVVQCKLTTTGVLENLDRDGLHRILEGVRFHECSCHAGNCSLITALRRGVFKDCPIEARDIENMCLFSDFLCHACGCGKSVRNSVHVGKGKHKKKPEHHQVMEVVENEEISEDMREVLGLDLMFYKGRIYLIAVGKISRYLHVVPIKSRTKGDVVIALKDVFNDYRRNQLEVLDIFIARDATKRNYRDFELKDPIKKVISDNEGAFIAAGLLELPMLGIDQEFVSSGEHVAFVERPIRTLKERASATECSLPYVCEDVVLDGLICCVARWMNILPSPKAPYGAWYKLTGYKCSYRALCLTKFGDPVIAHRTSGKLGSGQARGELGISLGPVCNKRGSIYFYSLITHQVKQRRRYAVAAPYHWTDHNLKLNKEYVGKGVLTDSYLEFMAQRPAVSSADDRLPESMVLPAIGSFLTTNETLEIEENAPVQSAMIVNEVVGNHEHGPINFPNNPLLTEALLENQGMFMDKHRDEIRQTNDRILMEEIEPDILDVRVEELDEDEENPLTNTTQTHGQRASRELREQPRRASKNKHKIVKVRKLTVPGRKATKVIIKKCYKILDTEDVYIIKTSTISWNKAYQKYDDDAEIAITEELRQIAVDYNLCTPVGCDVNPVDYHTSHDLFDIKDDGRKKARLVVGLTRYGTKIDYGIDLFSPTIDVKVVKLILSLGLECNFDLSVWDIKGAFLKSPMYTKGVYVLLRAHVVRRLLKIRPEWKEFVRKDGSMLVECNKAWYGLSAAAALWNKEIHNTLVNQCGYTQHSKVKCLYIKRVQGVNCYIMLHVDDMGVLMPPDNIEYDRVKTILTEKYAEMRIQTGDDVKYIGYEIKRNRSKNCFEISMKKKIEDAMKDFGITLGNKTVRNPARNGNFSKLKKDVVPFGDIKSYRSLVMTMAYISAVHPAIKYHVGYLATKQANPCTDDWDKAIHVMKYLGSSTDECMEVHAFGKERTIDVYQDAAYDVYGDSKSQTGIAVFIAGAKCAIYAASNKQHCVTRSSCDAEVVAAETGTILGAYYKDVLDELGYRMNVVHHEDNQSCIALVHAGSVAYDRKDCHTIRRVNFMHDYFKYEENRSEMVWCNTKEMIADVLTKDLHGELFIDFKSKLMGWT